MFKTQNSDLLKPGIVYEIREVMDTLVIVPVGPSLLSASRTSPDAGDTLYGVSWSNDVSYILECVGKHLILTRDEYLEQYEKKDSNDE